MQPDRPAINDSRVKWIQDNVSKAIEAYESHHHHSAVQKALLKGEKRVNLLKRIDQITAEIFEAWLKDSEFGANEKRSEDIKRAVFLSNFAGIPEGTDHYYECLKLKCLRMSICRTVIIATMRSSEDIGFGAWERTLITSCAEISEAYDEYYIIWLQCMQSPVLKAFSKARESNASLSEPSLYLLSPYTMVRQGSEFVAEPYAVFFEKPLEPVLSAFYNTTLMYRHTAVNLRAAPLSLD